MDKIINSNHVLSFFLFNVRKVKIIAKPKAYNALDTKLFPPISKIYADEEKAIKPIMKVIILFFILIQKP